MAETTLEQDYSLAIVDAAVAVAKAVIEATPSTAAQNVGVVTKNLIDDIVSSMKASLNSGDLAIRSAIAAAAAELTVACLGRLVGPAAPADPSVTAKNLLSSFISTLKQDLQ